MRATRYINRHGTRFLRPDKGVPLDWEDWKVKIINWEDEATIYEVPLPKYQAEYKQPVSAVIGNWALANIKSFLQP